MSFFSGLSLRQKLPLLVSVLTTGALVVGGALAYAEVSSAARTSAQLRLENVTADIGALTEANLRARWEIEDRIAASPMVGQALRGERLDTASLAFALDSLRGRGDGQLPVSLVRADGSLAFHSGALPSVPDARSAPPLGPTHGYGHLRPLGDQGVYWLSVPIPGEGKEPAGWILQRRRIGPAPSGDILERLVGTGVRVLLGRYSDEEWIDLDGDLVVAPHPGPHPADEAFPYERSDGEEMLAITKTLDGTPWIVHMEMPMSAVLARPRVFLTRIAAVGVVLVTTVLLIALRTSRRLTVPLEDLVHAADAVAAGDYRSRVHGDGDDEVARLGRAFNAMAEQVERSDEALRQRLDEQRALTMRLEDANVVAERAREEALSASRAKSEFLATMSHEIRTPINAVIGYTELMKLGIPDPPSESQRDYLDRIHRSSRLLIALVNDVLDLSRIESGTLRVELGRGSAEEAVLGAVAVLEPEAARKNITLTTPRIADGTFLGDEQRVQQILLNLLSNAVKFTPEGGAVTVRCAPSETGPPGSGGDVEWLRIDVVDTGIGIDEQQMERVFEPFAQADTGYTRAHGGAGLGLAISRRLAKLMLGDLTAVSEPGEGAHFTLWLRRARASEAAYAT